jgi:hypothetical protein
VAGFEVLGDKLRIQYPGAIYHVMNRGDRREPILKDDRDQIARRLRKETTMTLKWIAEKIENGSVDARCQPAASSETVKLCQYFGLTPFRF